MRVQKTLIQVPSLNSHACTHVKRLYKLSLVNSRQYYAPLELQGETRKESGIQKLYTVYDFH